MVGESRGKCKSDWKVREMLENFSRLVQSERTLAARRIIKYHIIHVDGVTNFEITRNMVVVARSARARYANYLAQQKEEQEAEKRNKKRKGEIYAIHELEGKHKRLKTVVSCLLSTSQEWYEKCKKSGELRCYR